MPALPGFAAATIAYYGHFEWLHEPCYPSDARTCAWIIAEQTGHHERDIGLASFKC